MSAEDESGGNGAGDDSASRIYVGNLIPKANEVHLKTLFANFGVIHNIWVARKPPGFAFVSYESAECAKRAVEAFEMAKDGERVMEILGKPVKVQMAGEKAKKKAKTNEERTQPDTKMNSNGSHPKTPLTDKKSTEKSRAAKRKEKNGNDKGRRHSRERQRKRSRSPIEDNNSSSDGEMRKHRSRSFASSSRGSRSRRSRSRSWSCRGSRKIVDLGRHQEPNLGEEGTIVTAEAGVEADRGEVAEVKTDIVADQENTPEAITADQRRDHKHQATDLRKFEGLAIDVIANVAFILPRRQLASLKIMMD